MQPALCGPLYRRNVTVPTPAPDVTGLTNPVIVAVSPIDPPTVPFVACVVIAGSLRISVLVSLGASHAPVAGWLLASPLKDSTQW